MRQVVQVHERRFGQVVIGEIELAYFSGEDGLYGCRQRGVAHGQRLVVREVARLLLCRERVAAHEHRENEVRLLDHLLAIEVKVRKVQKQGMLVRSGASEVPHRMSGKQLVL